MTKISIYHIVSIFIGVVILHFVADATGLYSTPVVWFDNVLHALVGLAFGLFLDMETAKEDDIFTNSQVDATFCFYFGIGVGIA